MTPAKTRSSNIELLRILAMFMIIIFHISDHCVKVQLTDTASMLRMNNGLFCEPVFYKKLLLLSTFAPMGKIGNVIFITISGYFIKCTLCQGHYDFSFSDFYFIFVCCVEASK